MCIVYVSDSHEPNISRRGVPTSISFPKKLALALVADSRGGGGAGPVVNFFKYTFFVVFQELMLGKAKTLASFGPFCTPPVITINLIIISYHQI